VGVQEVRWDKGGTERAEVYTFYGAENEGHKLGTGFFVHKRIISAVRRVEFVSDRISYIHINTPGPLLMERHTTRSITF
jgi:hypothetical protein